MIRGLLLAFAYAAIVVAILAARPQSSPGPAARDFEAYWSAGSTWNAHADPYTRSVWNAERTVPGVDPRHDELLPFINPPSSLPGWSVFSRMPYRIASALWVACLAIALFALVLAVMWGIRSPLTPFKLGAVLALAIAFGPITSDLALGQLALASFLGATLLVIVADSMPAAAAAATLAFMQPNVALGLASQLGRNRATLAIMFGVIATYGLGVVAAGWKWPATYAAAASAHGAAERFAAIQLTPAAIAYGAGAPPPVALLAAAAAALLAVAAALILTRRVRDVFVRFAAWSALAPFAAIFVHEHDLLVAFPAAVWCALHSRGAARTFALGGTLLVAVDWLGLAQRPTGVAQSALLAAAAAGAFVALGGELDIRRIWQAGVPVAALFALAAAVATYHPAPVWPAALGAFHAPADEGPAAVWLAEQRAAGLLTVTPVWAFLRANSLLGCALLAYAIYRHFASDRTA